MFKKSVENKIHKKYFFNILIHNKCLSHESFQKVLKGPQLNQFCRQLIDLKSDCMPIKKPLKTTKISL